MPDDNAWMEYKLELDILDQHAAHFNSEHHGATFTLPREQWEKLFDRPGEIKVRVTLKDN